MARYFKFKSAEQLEQQAARCDAPIRLDSDFSPLRQPLRLGERIVGNRLAIQPMEGCDAEPDGTPGELTRRRFRRFGGSGAKLIWGEATAVTLEAQANPRQLHLHADNYASFAELVRTCRQAHRETMGSDDDLLIGLQLTHSGRFCCRGPARVFYCPVLDAGLSPDETATLSDDALDRLPDAYVAAAKLAQHAGFDFVDVKQCHRYLLSELLAAKTRPGKYGGDLDNRARLVLEILGRIRDEVPGLLLASRLNIFDGIPYQKGPADNAGVPRPFTSPFRGGFGTDETDPTREDLTEPLALIGMLRGAGVGLLNLSMGCPYFNPHYVRPAEYPPVDGYDPPEHPLIGVGRHFRLTEQIARAFPDLPVVGSGYSYLAEYLFQAAAANVGEGRCSFAGLGRAALAYPDAVADLLLKGTIDPKRVCRTFSYCTNLMRNKNHPLGQYPTGCPPFDREVYHPIYEQAKQDQAKRDQPG